MSFYVHQAKKKANKLVKMRIVVDLIDRAELQRLLEQQTLAVPMIPVSS